MLKRRALYVFAIIALLAAGLLVYQSIGAEKQGRVNETNSDGSEPQVNQGAVDNEIYDAYQEINQQISGKYYEMLDTGQKLYWGYEPVEYISESRGRRILNGLWKFMPAAADAYSDPTDAWGYMWVPGTWYKGAWSSPATGEIERQGQGENWNTAPERINRGWYEREIVIPEIWNGKEVVLQFDRISTDAAVFIDGNKCGEVRWPGGELVITPFIKPGERSILRILVVADKKEENIEKLLEGQDSLIQSNIQGMEGCGLVGNVILESRPRGTRVEGVFVQTSVQNKELALDVDMINVQKEGKVVLNAVVRDSDGNVAQTFTAEGSLSGESSQTLSMAWKWEEPMLWDYKQPNLYTLELKVKGDGFEDGYAQQFGFREFRIEGKEFLLNGKPFRIRPVLHESRGAGGNLEVMANWIDGFIHDNFNLSEIWPKDTYQRGMVHYWPLWAQVSDEKGLPVMYPVLSVDSFLGWDGKNVDEALEKWEKYMVEEWKQIRNHPSIVILNTTANRFYHPDDQNPIRIGNSQKLSLEQGGGSEGDQPVPGADWWNDRHQEGMQVIDIIKKYDTTRPATSHHASVVGDIHTMNTYLDLIPLQEREEWLSSWVESGDKPYMAVEMGTPFLNTMLRGRNSFEPSTHTEPLMTEFAAIYLGEEAYELERSDPYRYRQFIVKQYQGGQNYGNAEFSRYSPAFQKLQELFITNTWRSWRAWGITGGMLPWSEGYVWKRTGSSFGIDMPEFEPGKLGSYKRKFDYVDYYNSLQPKGLKLTQAGQVFMEVNKPTLAWIGGSEDSFTEKDHHFYSRAKVQKQIIVVNDERSEQDYNLSWKVEVGGKEIYSNEEQGTISVGENLFIPFEFTAPDVEEKTEGRITLFARVGLEEHEDSFDFRVFSQMETKGDTRNSVLIYDIKGDTRKALERLGFRTEEWDGKEKEGAVLVIGRHSLEDIDKLPGSLDEFAVDGGKVVILAQDPDWMRDSAGLRVARQVSRRFYPVPSQKNHPILQGLDADDFRDWNGAGTLVPETAGIELDKFQTPPYGYHWGNTGSVSSAAIEKPHQSGWTPILEGEFDLAYTPLMELKLGKGLMVWCTLDLEGRTEVDPVADMLLTRIIDYAGVTETKVQFEQTFYLGKHPEDKKLLDQMGLVYEQRDTVPKTPALLIVGRDTLPEEAELRTFIEQGGKILFLGQNEENLPLGIQTEMKKNFGGSLSVPEWEECRGLSPSDLRLRVDMEASIIKEGSGNMGAEGLMARVVDGEGAAVFIQLAPDQLKADQRTYLRYSSWRLTRAIAQVITNLGGVFGGDQQLLKGGASQFYVPGFIDDLEMGDDPYRYYRW